ncbi:COR domain-containing protein [Bernardetia sp. OM2101]|uniref:COR domain-containing protein n=1 Tax=Bernardetia sp. OM2101 TaxID=3344876 RepID=UPI0035CEAEA3
MDKKKVNKPEQVLWLEEQLHCKFERFETQEELFDSGSTSYAINEYNEIVGLKFNNYCTSDISFLSNFANLLYLDFSWNEGIDISYLSELTQLTHLRFIENGIFDISSLSSLRSLTDLNIFGNYISDLSSLSNLINLTNLELSWNQILDISPLSNLINLERLSVGGNQILDFSCLSSLTNLTSLHLSDNICSDYSFLKNLKGLIRLNLDYNQISDISALSKLKKIKYLKLSHNNISDISSLSELEELINLNLDYNQISDISALSKLNKLASLNLSKNKISNISVLSELKKVLDLNISDNQVSDISFITELDLKYLSLNSNPISNAKDIIKIIQKEKLKGLDLYDNNIPYLPKELLGSHPSDNCLQDLRNYYQNQDFVPNKEIKVVILGNGMVGKSTLLKRFLNPTGDWETEIQIDVSKRTEGVAIERKEDFKLEGNEEINLNIWDFGGQEVYHGTHRLFLDKDAVYIIVWTLETDEQKEEIRQDLNYWLDYAQDLAIDSPIILVHSQIDKESEQDQDKIREQKMLGWNEKYKDNIIEEYLPFSAKEKIGVEELNKAIRKAIKDKLSDRVETKIPEKWSFLRDDLRKLRENEEDKKNEISKEDYLKECANYEIEESEAETVLTFLHRTGFLYYDTQLSNNIILNQTWAIEAIYEALKPKSIAKRAKGKLEYEDLESFWLEKNYSKTEAKTFIDFMVSSEICFCKEQQNYRELENPTFIVPHYLEEPSRFVTKWEKDNSFYIIYKPAFFHKGIAERFLSRLGRLSGENELWKDGIRIESQAFGDTEALITFDREKKEVNISTENYELLEAILKELNKILDEGSQTNPSEKVTFFYSLDGEGFVEGKKLLEQIKDGNYESNIRTQNDKLLKVKDFAEKFRLAQKSNVKQDQHPKQQEEDKNSLIEEAKNKKNTTVMNEKKPLKIFISYCSYDRKLRQTMENRLKVYLQGAKNDYETIWSDVELKVGDDWDKEIQDALNESTIGILLVSPDFLASEYCTGEELTIMLDKQENEDYLIVPILLRDCSFGNNEILKKMQLFKTYKNEYDIEDLNEINDLMPFEDLADIPKPQARLLNKYFKKLAQEIDDAVDSLK